MSASNPGSSSWSLPRLVAVARALGADVAFFLYGGCALMGGRGDVFECPLPPFAAPIVLMGSNDGLSTATVYRAFDDDPVSAPDADALAQALRVATDDTAAIAALCANNLGPAACAADPRIQQRLHAAREPRRAQRARLGKRGDEFCHLR